MSIFKTLPNNEHFDILNPDINMINLQYIAATLSRINRFGGDTRMNVAQHSVNVYRYIKTFYPNSFTHQLRGLMHDAAEAYLSDIITPIKRELYVKVGDKIISIQKVEKRLLGKIGEALDIPYLDMFSTRVKEADAIVGREECRTLLPGRSISDYYPELPDPEIFPDKCEFSIWSPEKSQIIFERSFNKIQRLMAEQGEALSIPF